MLGTERNSIIPCLGRDQPVRKYSINIKFHASAWTTTRMLLLVGCLTILISLGLWFFQGRPKTIVPASEITEAKPASAIQGIYIGKYLFDPEQQSLLLGTERIELTAKETKLLQIFTGQFHQIVDRKQLQKEVWEDEGVIVGRSLDMFVSKLRKKLSGDPSVKITNIHGKGYKLEVEACPRLIPFTVDTPSGAPRFPPVAACIRHAGCRLQSLAHTSPSPYAAHSRSAIRITSMRCCHYLAKPRRHARSQT